MIYIDNKLETIFNLFKGNEIRGVWDSKKKKLENEGSELSEKVDN